MASDGDLRRESGLVELVIVAAIAGAITGVAASSFRVLLHWISQWRTDLIHAGHDLSWVGFLILVVAVAAAASIAALLVHRIEPHAESSNTPRAEAVVEGRAAPGRFRILPVKYVGGLLAIGGGLALGREGPSVQMGGVIAAMTARLARLNRADLRVVVAGGAAAGLATAFYAPIAGGVFVLEELLKRFDTRATIATLLASGSGFASTTLIVHADTSFHMPELPAPSIGDAPLVLGVGLACGLLAVLYNRLLMAALSVADVSRVPVGVRAAAIGLGVGVLAWFAPSWVGSGDNLTEDALTGHGVLVTAVLLLVVRFVLSIVSYAALTPGGIFAPMLVLGAETGLIVALLAAKVSPVDRSTAAGLALIGMAALFAASVRAPVTGLVLATEMTGSVAWLPPMLGGCAVAMLVAILLRSEPIYDALTTRAARGARANDARAEV